MRMGWSSLGGLCVVLGLSGCLGPNPLIDAGAFESEAGDGDTGDDEPGDGDPGDGDPGDGDPGDGDPGDGDPGDGDDDPDHCDNDILDGDETDLDCGGSCSGCEPGSACLIGDDCDSLVCNGDVCAAASCVDNVSNGDELEIDCGGSCRFCTHSELVEELDDFDGSHAIFPNVAMFEDGVFALMYGSIGLEQVRLRWFDEFATPLSSGIPVTDQVTQSPGFSSQGLIATDDLDNHAVYALVNGLTAMSSNSDVFSVRRGPNTPASLWPIYQGPAFVATADGVLDGDIATFVWEQDGEVWLRRYNYALNLPVALATRANPDFALRPGKRPTIALRNGVSVVAWIACDAMDTSNCDVELRSSDFGWIENTPVGLGLAPQGYDYPQLAIAEDERVALVWSGGVPNNRQCWAAMLDPGLALVEPPWLLQDSLMTGGVLASDVAALEDDSFVFAWPDLAAKRVHVRRFSAPAVPVVTDVGDEAPWPAVGSGSWVRMSTAANLVTVVWGTGVNNIIEVQGQVLSY